ncbi:MAG: S41 family peptidase [Armatimonadota bacterium]
MMKSIFRSLRVIAPLFMLLILSAAAFAEVDLATRQETFERVWTIVNERFYDPNFNGVNWAAVKKEYEKKIPFVQSDEEFYKLLNDMVGELHCSHFAIIAPSSSEDYEVPKGPIDSSPGIKVRFVEDKPMITGVEPGSPAAKAGIRPGYIITRVRGRDIAKLWEYAKSRGTGKSDHYNKAQFALLMDSVLSGYEGEVMEIGYLDEKDVSRSAKVKLAKKKGQFISMAMFEEFVEFESKRIQNNIGYISFSMFTPDLTVPIKNAIRSFHDAPGIIIDLRGNPGGVVNTTMAISAMFYGERSALGTMKQRKGEIRYPIFPSKDPYKGILVILTDEASASSSEVLACGMQWNGRAIVVGSTSMGASLPSIRERLPSGAVMQYVIADFKTPNGYLIEGNGAVPDYPVDLTRANLLTGHDPVMDKAISVIKEKSAASAEKESQAATETPGKDPQK